MDKPLVSILVPCFNHKSFLMDCLNSITNQDYENIELLICDDCSTDDSYNMILSCKQQLEKRFKNVFILKNDINSGITKSLNRMLALSSGVYIKIIASDDAMKTNAISSMVNYLEENQDIDFATCNGIKVTEDQHYPNFESKLLVYETKPNLSSNQLFEKVARHNEIFAPGAIVRRSVYDKYGWYDEDIKIEDLEYWLRILKDGNVKVGFIDDKLIYYRISQQSMTSMVNNNRLAQRRRTFHNAVIQIYKKHQDGFHRDIFVQVVSKKILDEIYFAKGNNLKEFENELRKEFKVFVSKTPMSITNRIYYTLKYLKTKFK